MNIPVRLLLIGLFVVSLPCQAEEKPKANPNADSLQRLQKTLPFNLNESLQMFSKTVHGGVQHVVVISQDNMQQIQLIRRYLQHTAEQYRKGDFSVVEAIHGANMPGLAQLKAAQPLAIKYEYNPLDNGGQLHYSAESPLLVQALHEWLDAQANDHGNPNMPGHKQHHKASAE